ncbi:TolC family protein, partial [Paracidovorax cattleyae]
MLLPSPIPRPLRLGLAATAIAFLAGCSAPDVRRPEAPGLPATWTAPLPGGAAAPEFHAWWKAFHDPVLNALVDEALQKNLDLAIAAHRLREARLQAGRAAVQFRPSFGAGARTLQDIEATDSYFHVSIDMVWELGLFGAAENARESASADRDAAVADGQGARVAVVAEVVRNYLDLQAARRQLQLLDRQAAL